MSSRAVAVAFLAAATLSFEILLVRVFAVEHFHHVAYMAIGVAMLGIGGSGTLVALVGGTSERLAQRWFWAATLCTALSLIATPALLHQIDLDLTQLAWDAGQWSRLAMVYLLLAIPFALGALAILFAIILDSTRPGWIYGASFLGSGAGALLAIGVLWIRHPAQALAIPALVAAFAVVIALRSEKRPASHIVAAVLAVMFASLAVVRPPWRAGVSPYKGLPQIEAYPESRRVAEHTSPLGWIVAVRSPAFRYAPGLSLAYQEEFPPQTALFVDGEIAGAVTHWSTNGTDSSRMEILRWLPTALPYALGGRGSVLVLGAGGGMDVWMAVAHGARDITAVELNTALISMSAKLAPFPTRSTTAAAVDWIADDARTFAAGTRRRFDLITLAPGGGITGAAGGVHALNEDFLHTGDAYRQYLKRLTTDGVLSVTQWVTVPPRGSVRVILTAAEALRRVHPAAMDNGIVVARSWGTTTVLVKPSGFAAQDLERLRAWAVSRQVDLDWYPGATGTQSQYNIPDEPTLFHAARVAVASADSARNFEAAYAFAVDPVSDERPYPHRFLRAGSIGSFLKSGSTGWLPFAEWGYIALLATLVQSALLAGILIVLPVALRSRRTGVQGRSLMPLLAYFAAIGLGYMAAEIAVIQQLTLLLGHPVYAVAAVLAAILICSGVGSVLSDRLAPWRARTLGVVLACALAALAVLLLDVVNLLQAAPILARGVAAILVLAPAALAMGMMFPLGLRAIAQDDGARIAWAWSANGFASVVGVPLAALIAVESGSRSLLLVAAVAYTAAALAAKYTQ